MSVLGHFAGASVLLIDDTPSNVDLLRIVLRRAGLRNLHGFTDPREAVAQLDQIAPDLVLVDLHMPHLDGYAVLERLREHAGGAYLPALVLTADTTPEAIQRTMNSGARDFLTKPFDANEVVLRVRNLLETRELHQQLRLHNRWLRVQLSDYQRAAQQAPEMFDVERERIARTIDEQALACVFQPVFDLASGAIVGVEALARFAGAPQRGPDRWFAEAARVGLAAELESLAVRTALSALDQLPDPVFLAVNISPAILLSGHLPDGGTDWGRVILELTEHSPVEDYDTLRAATAATSSTAASRPSASATTATASTGSRTSATRAEMQNAYREYA